MSGNPPVTEKNKTTPRLKQRYLNEIIPAIMEKFKFKNTMQVPKMTKIVINIGVGEGAHDIKVLEQAAKELATITGQQPITTRAKKAISNFKIRKGDPVGCKVTLRGNKMYEFFDRMTNVAMPRIRDFRGISPDSFDDNGNYNLGLTEQLIFPEIEYDKVAKVTGMGISISTTAKDNIQALELLKLLGMPFRT